MNIAVFIDTSVLLNLLKVPGSSEGHDKDVAVREQLTSAGATLILPFTTIIETGNAITRDGGGLRYKLANEFVDILRATLAGTAPWVASGVGLTHALLEKVISGHGMVPQLLDLMVSGVGTGDGSILAEIAEYRTRIPSGVPIRIWTHDLKLRAYMAEPSSS